MAPPKLDDLITARKVLAFEVQAIRDDELPTMAINEHPTFLQHTRDLLAKNEANLQAILKLAPSDDHDTHMAEYLRIRRLALALVATFSPTPPASAAASPAHSLMSAACSGNIQPPISIRLPQVDLPTFNGNRAQWPAFAANFKSLIGRFPTLTDEDKLHYLQSSMKDNAKSLIAFITPGSGSAFDEAWALLETRFKNHRHTVYGIVRRLLAFKTPDDNRGLEKFIDQVRSSFATLSLMNLNPEDSAYIWNALILDKCNSELNTIYEQQLRTDAIPTTADLLLFIQNYLQVQAYTKVPPASLPATVSSIPPRQNQPRPTTKCPECKLEHPFYRCPVVNKATTADRYTMAKKYKLCINCLAPGHSTTECKKGVCKTCSKKHHTSLHREPPKVNLLRQTEHVLLQTAIVNLQRKDGSLLPMRAIIDSGSTSCLITANALQLLNIKPRRHDTAIGLAGGAELNSTKVADVSMQSTDGNFQTNLKAFAVPKITDHLPTENVDASWLQKEKIQLADPSFNVPGKIDILLGTNVLSKFLLPEMKFWNNNSLTAQNTRLGWVLQGAAPTLPTAHSSMDVQCHLVHDPAPVEPPTADIARFWEVEDLPKAPILTPEEELAELHFKDNTYVIPSGRFCVKLPTRTDQLDLGDSRKFAVARFLSLEKKFAKDNNYKLLYKSTIEDYLDSGHLQKASPIDDRMPVYLPHHGVFNASKKLRIVFDASAKTANGKSLNDMLINGPKTQDDLFSILVRFRPHQVAVTADITQMYRQVAIAPDDYHLQRILWRDSPQQPLQDYNLTVVTWGMKQASFLATRVLQEIADRASEYMPTASRKIRQDFYVDDFLSGAQDEQAARALVTQVQQLLANAGMELHKWASNANIFKDSKTSDSHSIISSPDDTKTLGLRWHANSDSFALQISPPIHHAKITKRTVLSDLGRFFDPLGWAAPALTGLKTFVQGLWQETALSWDSTLPQHLRQQWAQLIANTRALDQISIPRRISTRAAYIPTLCGFSDASETAYAAVVYLRQQMNDRSFSTTLVAAKTKVAPLKKLTLPRLELCGALLLARLMAKTSSSIEIKHETAAFTDSTITLHWLSAHPSRWKTFVSHRVQETQTLIPAQQWMHVASEDNPADLATRPLAAKDLVSNQLWWHGPTWLSTDHWDARTLSQLPDATIPEQSAPKTFMVHTKWPILTRFEDITRIYIVLAYVQRFGTPEHSRPTGRISAREISRARISMLRLLQSEGFSKEIEEIKTNGAVNKRSPLFKLTPYLDGDGILRSGGRLAKAEIIETAKHPAILPYNHAATKLIIRHLHRKHEHAGPTLLAAIVLQQFYIPKLRNLTRFVARTCAICSRTRAKTAQQLMADLPASRVITPARAFQRCGVDLLGPINLRTHLSRGTRHYKGYVCLFICMATRAIHLEVVSSLSAETFLAAFHRMAARRATPAEMFSDRGTNFTATSRLLKQFQEDANVHHTLTKQEVTWTFNPPSAPHWGGLWEAGVKSVKYHLTNIVRHQTLTFEEMTTVTCRVEAVLNSRPLTALSNDPQDFQALTPGHFLVGTPLTAPPEDSATSNLLPNQRWQLVHRLAQHFWKRWSAEYLTRLNERPKWCRRKNQLNIDDLVIVKDDNTAPLHWRLGRITALHKSSDGLPRAATVRTQFGTCERPIVKLAPLPLDTGTGQPDADRFDFDTRQLATIPLAGRINSPGVATIPTGSSYVDATQVGRNPLGLPTRDTKAAATLRKAADEIKDEPTPTPTPRRSARLRQKKL